MQPWFNDESFTSRYDTNCRDDLACNSGLRVDVQCSESLSSRVNVLSLHDSVAFAVIAVDLYACIHEIHDQYIRFSFYPVSKVNSGDTRLRRTSVLIAGYET